MEGRSVLWDGELTVGTDAWCSMIAESRRSPFLTENSPQVSKIKPLYRRGEWAINAVMGMNMFVKLKHKRERRLRNRNTDKHAVLIFCSWKAWVLPAAKIITAFASEP